MLAAIASFVASYGLKFLASIILGAWDSYQKRADQQELGAQKVAAKASEAAAELERRYADVAANPRDALDSLGAGNF